MMIIVNWVGYLLYHHNISDGSVDDELMELWKSNSKGGKLFRKILMNRLKFLIHNLIKRNQFKLSGY